MCENPRCKPKVECCQCKKGENGLVLTKKAVSIPEMFFKETEENPVCCPCGEEQEEAQ